MRDWFSIIWPWFILQILLSLLVRQVAFEVRMIGHVGCSRDPWVSLLSTPGKMAIKNLVLCFVSLAVLSNDIMSTQNFGLNVCDTVAQWSCMI